MTVKSRKRKLHKKDKSKKRFTFKHENQVVELVAPNLELAQQEFKLQYGYIPSAE